MGMGWTFFLFLNKHVWLGHPNKSSRHTVSVHYALIFPDGGSDLPSPLVLIEDQSCGSKGDPSFGTDHCVRKCWPDTGTFVYLLTLE